VVEVATMMTSYHTVPALSSYNTNIASKFFRKDLNHVLAQHRTDEIIYNNKSILLLEE
jgi:hypothetical protein